MPRFNLPLFATVLLIAIAFCAGLIVGNLEVEPQYIPYRSIHGHLGCISPGDVSDYDFIRCDETGVGTGVKHGVVLCWTDNKRWLARKDGICYLEDSK